MLFKCVKCGFLVSEDEDGGDLCEDCREVLAAGDDVEEFEVDHSMDEYLDDPVYGQAKDINRGGVW